MNYTQNIVLVMVVLVVRGDLQRVENSIGRLCYNMGLDSLFSSTNPLKLFNQKKNCTDFLKVIFFAQTTFLMESFTQTK